MRSVLITLVLVALIPINIFCQTPEYEKKIEEFLIVSGTMETVESSISLIIDDYKNAISDVPESFWEDIVKNKKDDFKKNFVKNLVPVYYKYLKIEEIDYVIKFYKSEIGKKYAGLTNTLMEEGAKAGESWGQYISEQISSELEKSGY